MKPIKNFDDEYLIKISKKYFNNYNKENDDIYIVYQNAFLSGCDFMRENAIKENSKLRRTIDELKSVLHQYKKENFKLANLVKKLKKDNE